MVRLALEIAVEVVVVTFELVFHFLLLISHALHGHSFEILLQFDLLRIFHQTLIQPQLLKRLLQPPLRLLLHPLLDSLILRDSGLVGRALSRWALADEGEGIVGVYGASAVYVLLFDEALEFAHFGFAFDCDLFGGVEEIFDGWGQQLVQNIKLHHSFNDYAKTKFIIYLICIPTSASRLELRELSSYFLSICMPFLRPITEVGKWWDPK